MFLRMFDSDSHLLVASLLVLGTLATPTGVVVEGLTLTRTTGPRTGGKTR